MYTCLKLILKKKSKVLIGKILKELSWYLGRFPKVKEGILFCVRIVPPLDKRLRNLVKAEYKARILPEFLYRKKSQVKNDFFYSSIYAQKLYRQIKQEIQAKEKNSCV